jgi:hypothetical protein
MLPSLSPFPSCASYANGYPRTGALALQPIMYRVRGGSAAACSGVIGVRMSTNGFTQHRPY